MGLNIVPHGLTDAGAQARFVRATGRGRDPVHVAAQEVVGGLGPLAISKGADMKQGLDLAVEEINGGTGIDVGGTAHEFEVLYETKTPAFYRN